MESDGVLRIAVVGEAGVGKSALVVRLLTGRFLQHYDPTLEDEYRATVKSSEGEKEVTILDTAGQESGRLDFYLHSSDVVLVTFSLGDYGSFQHAKDVLTAAADKQVPAILVGTKVDLDPTDRIVSEKEALSVANDLCCPYRETSAACGVNVGLVFQIAANLGMAKIRSAQETLSLKLQNKEEKSKPIKGVLKRWKSIRLRRSDTQGKILNNVFVSTL